MPTRSTIFSGTVTRMERGNPTKEHMTALYDLINKLFAGQDVFYSEEELEEIKEKGTTTWV